MYDPKFTQKEMYDQYGSSRKTTKTKPNPGKQFADTMKAGGGGRNTSGIGAKRPPSNTFGGGQDNNPNRDEYENKPTIDKIKEKAVNLFESLGADKPEALIVDGKRVYQGPLFRGYDPTARIGEFGGDAGKKQYRFGMPLLGEVSPSYPSPTLPSGSNNPTLNMFGVRRGFTGGPDMPELPTSTDVPANMDSVSRALSQAMRPTEVNYTIQEGDTLSEIAREAGTTVEELKELNNIEDVDVIDAGAKLKVPVVSAKLTDTQAALRRGLGSKKDNKGIKTAGGTMEELRKLLKAYTDEMEGKITTDPDSEFYNSFNQDVMTNEEFDKALVDRLKTEEGFDYVAEKKFGEEFYTIGHGHYGSDVKKGQTITKEEADKLLKKDIEKRLPAVKRKIKNFDDLTSELQIEIVQSWFRGGISGSPKTIALINEGKFEEASKEFLDNNEYRTTKLRGVKNRMKGLSDSLKKEADK